MGPSKMLMASSTDHPIIKQIKASKRIIGTKPKNPKQPLELEHIKNTTGIFGSGNLSNLQTTCLVVLGFSGFLCWDGLLRLSREVWNSREYMRVFLEKKEK